MGTDILCLSHPNPALSLSTQLVQPSIRQLSPPSKFLYSNPVTVMYHMSEYDYSDESHDDNKEFCYNPDDRNVRLPLRSWLSPSPTIHVIVSQQAK
jgi:hypothetical protein